MKALMQKDLFVLKKQLGYYVVLFGVYAVIPNTYLNYFGVLYGAMLPYSAMTCDERCKWDRLAAMMPYRDRDIVLSKYALGWMFSAVAAVVTVAAQMAIRMFNTPAKDPGVYPGSVLTALGIALCVISLTMPAMFRFGVEKGRIIMFILIALICGVAGGLSIAIEKTPPSGGWSYWKVLLPLFLTAAVLTAASVPLSVRMYQKRKD